MQRKPWDVRLILVRGGAALMPGSINAYVLVVWKPFDERTCLKNNFNPTENSLSYLWLKKYTISLSRNQYSTDNDIK